MKKPAHKTTGTIDENEHMVSNFCRSIFKLLTQQEARTAAMIWMNFSDKMIGEHMKINVNTVRFHLNGIATKTGHRTRVQIALLVERAQAVPLPEIVGCIKLCDEGKWFQKRKRK